ncbi:MAG: putative hydrolase [Patescibacteria group bacterium]|jgi:predicted transcriptional regulator|nr:putative hydrolase [Patescibacteria group bacterium]
MKQLHPLQLQILKKLLFASSLRYTEMRPDADVENNSLDFHLDKMIKAGYVHKNDGAYSLTSTGKEYANRIDAEKTII